MTTPVFTFQDILDIVDQEPKLRESLRDRVLDDELRETPRRLNQLIETVSQLAAVVAANNERLDRLEAIVAANNERLDRLEAIVADNTERIARLEAAVAQLIEAVAQLAATVQRLDAGYTSMSGKIDNLNGSRYEQQVAHLAPRYARSRFSFRSAAVTHRAWQHGGGIIDAIASDRITDRDAGSLLNADVIVSGALENGAPAYITGEISLTVAEHDVHRADARARILDAALGDSAATVLPVAFGAAATDAATTAANRLGVSIIIVPDYGADETG